MRNHLKYKINKANTERYKNSSIPYMQRLLNDDSKKRKREMIGLNIELSKSKKRRQGKWTMSVVLTITVENKAYYYYYYYYYVNTPEFCWGDLFSIQLVRGCLVSAARLMSLPQRRQIYFLSVTGIRIKMKWE